MTGSNVMETVLRIVEAHGGACLWSGLQALDAVISARGFLFTAKRRPFLDHVRVRAYAHEPRFSFFDFPLPGRTADLFGNDEVRITDRNGEVIARRMRPREAFRGLRRQFTWDDLDFIYFGGYATWNYLTTPFLFLRSGFRFFPMEHAAGFRLRVSFPEDLPTHCAEQIFTFDDRLHLKRLDYTAEVVGRWAHAAHLCDGYRSFGGIMAPTRRRVLPLLIGQSPLPGPTLVEIVIHDLQGVTV